ncbi:MAG: Tex-like N-terminal domain-containing protein [Planctomycetota bacterium]
MTTPILSVLAKEFSIREDQVSRTLELLGQGLRVPYLAHYRRAETGGLTEGPLRRLERRRRDLEELEKRRGTLLAQLAKEAAGKKGDAVKGDAVKGDAVKGDAVQVDAKVEEEASGAAVDASAEGAAVDVAAVQVDATADVGQAIDSKRLQELRAIADAHELEDYFVHHRSPEPEVQLALDRGLDDLTDVLTRLAPKPAPTSEAGEAPADTAGSEAPATETPPTAEATPAEPAATEPASGESASGESASAEPSPADVVATEPTATEPAAAESAAAEPAAADAAQAAGPTSDAPASATADAPAPKPAKSEGFRFTKIQLSPELARAVEPFVQPDRGVHTEIEAIEGAARILADRVARNPSVRAMVRRLVRKHGKLAVSPLADEKRLGRFKALLKQPKLLRQLQGHKLLELRQAQQQRLVTTSIEFDPEVALGKVQAKVCRRPEPFAETFVRSVCEQAVVHRILPMIADDIRDELRERAEEEGVRRIAQVLRQVLLSPVGGRRTTAGIHVDAKEDWTIVTVDADGRPLGDAESTAVKVAASSLELAELAQTLQTIFAANDVDVIAISAGKSSRAALAKVREALHALGAPAPVVPVSDAGLTAYANSELARRELRDMSVPARIATSLARRFQDPMAEFVKCETRHLVGGKELGAIGKANLRRVLAETVESSVAMVGLDVNEASVSLLRHVPGLDFELAKKLVEQRATTPVSGREELRELLPDERWTNAVGFLRVRQPANEALDRTSLHPEQYGFAREVTAKYGIDLDENLGRKDAFRGLKKSDFDVEEGTWRDLVRELNFPGRDPRLRNFPPRYLPADTDLTTIEVNQVVEGVVTNVTSFGAFVDLGLGKDGMVHISEASGRYVSDVRAHLSVGQVLRARVTNPSGPRIELSLKDVPAPERPARGGGRRAGPGGAQRGEQKGGPRRRRESAGAGQESWPQFQPMQRVATARRDGLGGASDGQKRGRGGRGAGGPKSSGGRGGGGGGGGGRRGDRRDSDEGYDRDAIKKVSEKPDAYNPFANFFKKDSDE